MELNQRELNAMYVSLKEMCSNVDLDSIPMFRQGSKLIPRCKNGSGIHIKKENRGKFTASAKKAGQSVQEHARSVLTVSYTHLRAHETGRNLVCRLLLEKKKKKNTKITSLLAKT